MRDVREAAIDIERWIDPELLEELRGFPSFPERPQELEDLASIRKIFEANLIWDKSRWENRPDVTVERRTVTLPNTGEHTAAIAVSPKKQGTENCAAVLWIHGGGFFMGSAESQIERCVRIAIECNAIVVLPSYRLAPEHPYPAPLLDCYGTLLSLCADESIHIDKSKIAVGGVSAGACLAAGVSLMCRDFGGPPIKAQVLMTPALDDREGPKVKFPLRDPRLWNLDMSRLAWKAYLLEVPQPVPYYAAPARAESVAGLPRTLITVEDLDILREEGIDFGLRLMRAEVPTEIHTFSGAFHGSVGLPNARVSKRHNDLVVRTLRDWLL